MKRPQHVGERSSQRPYVPERGRGRSLFAGEISPQRQEEQANAYRAWLTQQRKVEESKERRRMLIEKRQRERKEKAARRTAPVTDRRSIDVRIMNNSDISILYVIEYASGKVRQQWLSPRTQADEYMKGAGGWPTLNLYYKSESDPIKEIDSYTPSKYIPNLHVTIKNDRDILDVEYEEF